AWSRCASAAGKARLVCLKQRTNPPPVQAEDLSHLPSVEEVVLRLSHLTERFPRRLVVDEARRAIAETREEIRRGRQQNSIEIDDGVRIPDIMQRSGAILREVGTTNRTRIEDYREAIGDRTRLLLRVHPSNFRIQGFTAKPKLSELAALAKHRGIPLYEDLGS